MSLKKKKSLVQLYYDIDKESKEKYGENTVVFLQKGKFYELYSVNPSFPKVCDILNLYCSRLNTKIKQEVCLNNPYFAGFQTDFIDRYIKILLDKQYSIVVVDETCLRKDVKKGECIPREISRIISPSTYIESQTSNPLLVLYFEDGFIAMSCVELSTGKIEIYPECKYKFETVRSIVSKIQPSETIMYFKKEEELNTFSDKIIVGSDTRSSEKKLINKDFCKVSFQNQFLEKIYVKSVGITPIESIHLERYPLSSTVLTLLLQFAIEHDSLIVNNLKKPQLVDTDTTLYLSENCLTQLHIKQLIKYLDLTLTPMGSRLLQDRILNPSTSVKIIEKRLNFIRELKEDEKRIEFLSLELKKIKDIDRLFRKMCSGKLGIKEFICLYESFVVCEKVLSTEGREDKVLQNSDFAKRNLKKLLKNIEKNIDTIDERVFNPFIYPSLDCLINEKNKLLSEFEDIRKNIDPILKVGNANNSLYLISKQKVNRKDLIVKYVSSEYRITTNRIDEISDRINYLENEITIETNSLFKKYCSTISEKYSQTITNISSRIANIDLNLCGCFILKKYRFSIPNIENEDESCLNITGIRHPLIESEINYSYVENDVELNTSQNGILLYGLNFSGKTSYIRSVGICVILSQAGFPVPSKNMTFFPFKKLITKISLGDNILRGQSTFTNEMKEMKNMIEETDENSIILADELCSGTEYTSALSLVASTILSIKSKFIFTTHFHDLVDIPQIKNLSSVKTYHMQVNIEEGKLVFDRKLKQGKCRDNYGIEIAQFMKMPQEFIYLANSIRNELNKNNGFISTKQSRYNKDVYMTECKVCKSTKDLHTHHVIFQKEFDKKDVTKNYKNNLLILCEECHQKVHKNELNIKEYLKGEIY